MGTFYHTELVLYLNRDRTSSFFFTTVYYLSILLPTFLVGSYARTDTEKGKSAC